MLSIILSVAAAGLILWYLLLYCQEKLPGIPGPRGWPLLGNVLSITPHQLFIWANKYGSVFKIRIFEEELLVVTGTEAIEEACKRRHEAFDGRADRYRYRAISLNYSDLCFTRGCERVWWTRTFVEQRMTEHMGGVKVVEKITTDVIRELMRKLDGIGENTAFNPVPHLKDASLQILHVLMFQERPAPNELQVLREIHVLLVEALAIDIHGVVLDRAPWTRFLPGMKQTYHACQHSLDLYKELYAKWKMRCLEKDDVGGVVRHLIKLMGEHNTVGLTDDNIITLIQNLMVAGNMNISSLMSSLLNIMVHYPAVQTKVQQEADRVVGYGRQVSSSDEKSMKYTQAVVLELLRFAHPAPFSIMRRSIYNSTLCGYPIPKGINMIMNLWGHHHSPTLWTDPFSFRPDRFLDKNGDLLPASHPSKRNLLPFGTGSRACVGARLGLQHLFLMTATVLHNFRIRPADTELSQPSCDPRSMVLGIVMMPQEYRIKVSKRSPMDNVKLNSTTCTTDSTSS